MCVAALRGRATRGPCDACGTHARSRWAGKAAHGRATQDDDDDDADDYDPFHHRHNDLLQADEDAQLDDQLDEDEEDDEGRPTPWTDGGCFVDRTRVLTEGARERASERHVRRGADDGGGMLGKRGRDDEDEDGAGPSAKSTRFVEDDDV